MRIGSMFSGYGGLDMAVESVFPGATPAWFCEWDDAPSKILAHHWPDVPNLRDVTAVDWTQVEPVDILAGGFPCQDVSHAGRRQGLIRDGEGRTRSGLWGQMLKAIDTIRPSLVLAENVRGLLSAKADSDVEPCAFCMGDDGAGPMRALGAVLADLADIGYDATWCGLRAADVGAAHGRFRVFILAWPSTGDADGAPRQGAVAGVSGRATVDAVRSVRAANLTLLPTPAVNDMGASYTPESWDEWTARMKSAHGNGNGHGKSLSIEAQRLLSTPQSRDYKGVPADGFNQACLVRDVERSSQQEWGQYADAIRRWESILGRHAPSPTESRSKGAPRLSPSFVEWLMGLPAGHVTDPAIGLTRNQQLKALGNGVVPLQGAAGLRHLLDLRSIYATQLQEVAA